MENTEIKACPFCGQPGIVVKGRRHSNGEWVQIPRVWCKPCGLIKHGNTDEEALIKWNTRAGDRQPVTLETGGAKAVSSGAGLDGESEAWRKEADKIIAAYPEKHRDYHAIVLRHAYERGLFETNCAIKSLMAIKELIIKGEYSDERVLELINEEQKCVAEPPND